MPLSFAQLITPLSEADFNALQLNALAGVGPVSQVGIPTAQGLQTAGVGTGTVAYVSGTPAGSYSVVILIAASGEPGAATFQLSTDGGATYGAVTTMPSSGASYTLGSTGVVISFNAGPIGAGTSFVAGDKYSFSLSVPSFPVTAWAAGSVPRTLVGVEAKALADYGSLVALLAAGGLVNYASGPWLDLLGVNVYGLTRNAAVATKGTVTLTDSASAGPFNVAAGGMSVASSNGLLFTNVSSFTLTKGGSIATTFQAAAAGVAYNVGDGSITTISAGTLPGVTVSNAGPGWITTQGVDTETDAAYAARCMARWPALGAGAPVASTYDLWAKTASTNVTRTVVFADPTTPGQVDIYLAGPSGPSGGSDVTAVTSYINQRTGLTNSASIQAATAAPITVQTSVTYKSSVTTLAAVQTGIAANLSTFFGSAAMGKDSGGSVKVYLDQLRQQIMAVTGMVSCDPFVSPGGDTALTTGQVATLAAGSNVGTTWSGWTFTAI